MGAPVWVVVVPVKRLAVAKTRLSTGDLRRRLALAVARDTVRAAVACPAVASVTVVTDDPTAAAAVTALGARCVPDRPAAGLNPALVFGAQGVPEGWGRAALTADLPALRPSELAEALHEAAGAGPAFVADAAGTGTTLLAAPPGTRFEPRFGAESARRHAAAGARRLSGDWPSLRRDVDTVADLAEAARLGLGPYTAALWPRVAPPDRR